MGNDLLLLRDTVSRALVPLLWLHVPLVAVVAEFAGNDWLSPCIVAAGVASVATAAWLHAPFSSSTRLTIAVALVGMVSIIVAASRGSTLQIDVHMYYFAALAILAAYCDRNVILAASAVTAVHHITLNFLAPELVFPEGSEFGRVLMHAGILVMEAAALIWMVQRIVSSLNASTKNLMESVAAQASSASPVARPNAYRLSRNTTSMSVQPIQKPARSITAPSSTSSTRTGNSSPDLPIIYRPPTLQTN